MKIDIVSRDERYIYLNELLNRNGYSAYLTAPSEVDNPDILVLSVRAELKNEELAMALEGLPQNTKVFTGREKSAREYFSGEIIDYSRDENFLQKNAYLTAEGMISVWHSVTKKTPSGKKLLISGYGRIGKCLARIFSSLGAQIFVYARREESIAQVIKDGYTPAKPDFAIQADAVFNTAPAIVFSSDLINNIPESTYLFELASQSGFEKTERVVPALGLPGKILPKSAGRVIYDTITSLL